MKRPFGISAFALKCIAVVSMFIDHLGYTQFPGVLWLRCIGRLAFPIFAFQIAEGARRTENLGKYLARLAVFAVIALGYRDQDPAARPRKAVDEGVAYL